MPVEKKTITADEGIDLAVQSLEDGQPERARVICEQILGVLPDNPQALLLRAMAETAEDRLGAAEETVRKVLDIEPGYGHAQRHLEKIGRLREKARSVPYVREYLENRAVYMDYPRNIGIETVGRCNAKCDFCPHGGLDRKFTAMPDALFDKIIHELQEIPSHLPTRIFPNVVNEPFMDKKIFQRLCHINEALPKTKLTIFTNFNVLPKGAIEKIRGIRNMEWLNISFNAANKKEYEDIMAIDFDRTVGNLKQLMAANRKKPFLEHPVVLSRVADHTGRDETYGAECRALFADFSERADYVVHVKNRHNWLATTEDAQSRIPHAFPCGAWFDINILCTGVVPLCCADADARFAIGDVNENTVLEIYNTPEFKTLRQNETTREGIDHCGSCSLIQ